MDIFNRTLSESSLILNTRDLDPLVFQINPGMAPILRDGIRMQILKDVDEIRYKVTVQSFIIVGDVLTKKYQKDTPINVVIEIDPFDINAIISADLLSILNKINDRLAADTLHPIRYYITTQGLDRSKTIASYDVLNDKWIKTSNLIKPAIEKIFSDFCESLKNIDIISGKVNSDVLDYDALGELDINDIRDLHKMIKQKTYEDYELVRNDIKNKPYITDDIEKITIYAINHKLNEFTRQKLYGIYYSRVLMNELLQLIDFKKRHKENIEKSIRESVKRIGKLRISGNSHLYKMRGLNRKTLEQVPRSQHPQRTSLTRMPVGLGDIIKGMNTPSSVVDIAKKATRGVWRVTKREIPNIADKYGFDIPTSHKPIKHLGSTGIQMIRVDDDTFYLYKSGKRGYKRRGSTSMTKGIKVK